MQRFENAREAALALRPDAPVYCFRPEVLKADARSFMEMFPGRTAYAVKTNGERIVLKALVEAGVTMFDVASPGEFAAVREVSDDAEMIYMHPVKAQADIRLALETYGIRVIAVDHEDEISKLNRVVRALDIDPGAITVFVRVQTKGSAAYELSKKFGAGPAYAVELAERLNRYGYKVGLCFHVGSQIEDPDTYERALASVDWVRNRIGFDLAGLDVGGGFPAEYGHDPEQQEAGDAVDRPDHVALSCRPQGIRLRRDAAGGGARPGDRGALPVAHRARAACARGGGSTSMTASGRRCRIHGPARSRCRRVSFPIRRSARATAMSTRSCRSRSAGRPAIPSTSCPGRSGCRRRSTPATGSRSAISAPIRCRCRTRFNGFYPDTFVEVATPFDEGDAPVGLASLETMAD